MAETNKNFVDFVNGKAKGKSSWSFVDVWKGKEATLLFEGKTGAIVAVNTGDALDFWRRGAEDVANKVPFSPTSRRSDSAHINGAMPVIVYLPYGEDGQHSTRYEQHREYSDELTAQPLIALVGEAIEKKGTAFGIYLHENGILPQNMPDIMWADRKFVDLVMAEEPFMLANISRDTLSYEDGLKALAYEEAHMMIEEGLFEEFFAKFPTVKAKILEGKYGKDVHDALGKWNNSKAELSKTDGPSCDL